MTAQWKTVEDGCSSEQTDLRRALGIHQYLKSRRCWLLDGELHVEIYESSPEAPNLIFLPGIGTYVELYAELLHAVKEQGFNVVAIDPPGHGYSAGVRGEYRVDKLCELISGVIDQLSSQYSGEWSIYGYSIGALAAVAAGERDARIKNVLCGTLLITECPPDLFHMMGWSWTSMSALFFPGMRVPLKSFIDFETLLGDHPAGPYINEDPRIIFDYPLSTLANLFTHRSGIVKNEYPFRLFIVQGDRDEVLSIEYARQVQSKLKQPSKLVEIPGQGHMLPWDMPHKLAKILTHEIRSTK